MFYCFFWAGEVSRGAPITFICDFFYVGSPKGIPFFFRGEDFLRFFLEPFLGAIAITTATTAITIVTAPPVIIITITTAIGGTLIKVKVFPFRETF